MDETSVEFSINHSVLGINFPNEFVELSSLETKFFAMRKRVRACVASRCCANSEVN